MNLTASSTWVIGQKSNVKLVTYLVTFTFNDPPNLSTHYSTCYLECDEVPCKAPWATNWETELVYKVYCLLPTFTSTVNLL
jgi:hypothetical protein